MIKIKKIMPLTLIAIFLISSMGFTMAARINTNSTNNTAAEPQATVSNGTFNITQISQAAGTVKSYVETNNKLPNNVTIGAKIVTMNQFLYLLATATQNINSGNKTSIALKNVGAATSPYELITSGTIAKSEYLSVASKVKSYIETYGRVPNYASTSLGKMRFESLVYMYSKILNYYNTNKILPNTVSVKAWNGTTNSSGNNTGNSTGNNSTTSPTTIVLGSDAYGYVEKIGPFGSGPNKVAIIIGVHPQEGNVRKAMYDAITSATNLNNTYYIYRVILYNGEDRDTSRAQGENLANKFIVPDISTIYKLAVDVHGNRGNYISNGAVVYNFVFAPSQGTSSVNYANKLVSKLSWLKYYYTTGTSPPKVTIPIANKGVPAIVFELYRNVEQSELLAKCQQFLAALDAVISGK